MSFALLVAEIGARLAEHIFGGAVDAGETIAYLPIVVASIARIVTSLANLVFFTVRSVVHVATRQTHSLVLHKVARVSARRGPATGAEVASAAS